jgi:DNA-directed RNA polymerase specialized sigma24 family protein
MFPAASAENLTRMETTASPQDRTGSCEVRAMLETLPETLRLPLLLRYMEG